MIAVLFCSNCGPTLLDVNIWKDAATKVIRCYDCHTETPTGSLTIGRVPDTTEEARKVLLTAVYDIAEHKRERTIKVAALRKLARKWGVQLPEHVQGENEDE